MRRLRLEVWSSFEFLPGENPWAISGSTLLFADHNLGSPLPHMDFEKTSPRKEVLAYAGVDWQTSEQGIVGCSVTGP